MQLKNDLQSRNFAPVYFFYGEEHYLIRHYLSRFVQKVVTDNPEFNLDEFDSGVSVQQIYDSAMAFPLMSERKCVSVCDLKLNELPQSEFKELVSLVSDPNPTTVLIFWFETVDIPQKKMPDRFVKLIAAIEKGGGKAVRFEHKSEAETVKLICDGASKRMCRIQPTSARYMMSICGDSLFTLINELDKLCAYAVETNDGIIDNLTVDAVCSRTVEASAYGISKAIFSDDLCGALKLLDDLFYMRIEPIVILSGMTDTYVDIYRITAAQKAAVMRSAVAKDLSYGNREFRLELAERYARKLTPASLSDSLDAIAKADERLKSSRENPKTVMEELLVTLAYIKAKGVRP